MAKREREREKERERENQKAKCFEGKVPVASALKVGGSNLGGVLFGHLKGCVTKLLGKQSFRPPRLST